MSDNEGEEAPREDGDEEAQDAGAAFQFYARYTKPLVLDLPSPEDRALAAAWVTKLETEPEAEEEGRLRVDYLKLLLFAMQRGRLSGLFRTEPPDGPLEPFANGAGLSEMGNLLLEQADRQGSGDADGRGVSYTMEISNDLKEFVAAQEIPDFGVQVYYAWSTDDEVHKWSAFDEAKFPQYVREKIRQLKVANSEEKTNVGSSSYERDQVDASPSKSCDSSALKPKIKVKSPQEIERSQDRCYRSFVEQRGSGSLRQDRASGGSSPCKSHSGRKMTAESSLPLADPEAPARLCGKLWSGQAGPYDGADDSEEVRGPPPLDDEEDGDADGGGGGLRPERSVASGRKPGRFVGSKAATCGYADRQRAQEANAQKRLRFKQQS